MDNRTIDRLVAEHVLGLKVQYDLEIEEYTIYVDPYEVCIPRYSIDWGAAGVVWGKMAHREYLIQLVYIPPGNRANHYCEMRLGENDWLSDWVDTGPLAICLAALKALNVEIPE